MATANWQQCCRAQQPATADCGGARRRVGSAAGLGGVLVAALVEIRPIRPEEAG